MSTSLQHGQPERSESQNHTPGASAGFTPTYSTRPAAQDRRPISGSTKGLASAVAGRQVQATPPIEIRDAHGLRDSTTLTRPTLG
jgi:hypothetical protein